ncbi:MAG TPA: Type 1 glutamine amidotransferase-like domain-containing protein, partial [Pirellulaceae bacterium]|nr:Type 1 glutamine amidotransferase-like domain-containing protein [Pirellulaceae bacterium]
AERLIHSVLRRGGIIGGSSAGASIQGDFLVRGHPLGPQFMIAPGYLRGMSFLPGTAIDQHFTQRKRQADLEGLLARFPQYLGIGLDETTAIIVRGEVAKVVGKHHAHFFDPSRRGDDGRPQQDAVPHGGAYDLARRCVLEVQSNAEAAGK